MFQRQVAAYSVQVSCSTTLLFVYFLGVPNDPNSSLRRLVLSGSSLAVGLWDLCGLGPGSWGLGVRLGFVNRASWFLRMSSGMLAKSIRCMNKRVPKLYSAHPRRGKGWKGGHGLKEWS